jgi:hypothetical protein
MIKNWNQFIREFIENSDNLIDAKMSELNDLVSNISDGTNIMYQWENKDNHELIINFLFNGISVRYELDIDGLNLSKFANDVLDFNESIESIDEALDIIEKDIHNILGISEAKKGRPKAGRYIKNNMKYLKSYNKLFENHQSIHNLCKEYGITNYTINDDLSIDVDGDVDLANRGLTKIPIKFRNVSVYFNCGGNQLTTLEGAPQSVGGDFFCTYNQLTTLEGAPQTVGGDFYCNDNQLTTLEGAPQSVSDYFNCYNNQLTSLEGAPQSVGGYFNCSYNQLTTLEGAPQSVGGHFNCRNNQLTTLEGAPQSVGGDFNCSSNQLTTLEGAPQSVGGNFFCYGNPIYSIWILFKDYSKIELFNDCDPLREIDGKSHVVIDRLNQFLQDINKRRRIKVDDWINI